MPKFRRAYFVYVLAIPLALILGCLASTPGPFSFAMLGIILFFFALPLLMQWHHALLILLWNSALNAYFLPGGPDFWLLMTGFSLCVATLNHIMFQKSFLRVPEMIWPILFLALVVLGTACYRGGIGIRALGGNVYGGRYYINVLGAMAGYFALISESIPIQYGGKMVAGYFLSGVTSVIPNLAYALGPAFNFMYWLVPAGTASGQAAAASGLTNIDRISGLSETAMAASCVLLAQFGLRGLFDWRKPWRIGILVLTITAGFFSGFRSMLLILFLVFAFQFYFEGLFRTHFLPVVIGLTLFGFVPLVFFASKLPPSVQRTVSFLPVNVDSEVRADATGSSDWRFQMWAIVLKDVPKYLLIGKGYSVDPTDMFLTTEAIRMGLISDIEEPMLAGDYHSGPLSVIVPFGIFGTLGFVWLLGTGYWVMYSNFRHGDPALRRANTVLLSFYLAQCVSFFFIFGAFNSQLTFFLGAIGLSVSLNGGVKRASVPVNRFVEATNIVVLESKP